MPGTKPIGAAIGAAILLSAFPVSNADAMRPGMCDEGIHRGLVQDGIEKLERDVEQTQGLLSEPPLPSEIESGDGVAECLGLQSLFDQGFNASFSLDLSSIVNQIKNAACNVAEEQIEEAVQPVTSGINQSVGAEFDVGQLFPGLDFSEDVGFEAGVEDGQGDLVETSGDGVGEEAAEVFEDKANETIDQTASDNCPPGVTCTF